MENEKKNMQDDQTNNAKVTPSSADSKNDTATGGTSSATERVKPGSGDGLANEGTNVDYNEQR